MVIAFATNQAMTAIHGTPSIISTDPVPLNGADRVSVVLNVHYLWKAAGAAAVVAYQGEVSMNGSDWIPVTALTENLNAAGIQQLKDIAVYGAFIRFFFTLTVTGSTGDLGGTCFDVQALVDKA
jgi:hypothetical protein